MLGSSHWIKFFLSYRLHIFLRHDLWAGLIDALPASVGHFWICPITHKTLWRNRRRTIPLKDFLHEKPSNIWLTFVDFLFCQRHSVMLSNSVCFTMSFCHLKDEWRHIVGTFQAQLCVPRSCGNVGETQHVCFSDDQDGRDGGLPAETLMTRAEEESTLGA